MLNAFSRNTIHHVSFKFLRSKVWEGLWECLGETGAEHDDELETARVSRDSILIPRVLYVSTQWKHGKSLTAISGLSANTNSCGGDGSRTLCGGGEGSGAWVGLGTLEKNLRIPSFLVNCNSSSDGTEESSEESESVIVIVVVLVVCETFGDSRWRRGQEELPTSATMKIYKLLV